MLRISLALVVLPTVVSGQARSPKAWSVAYEFPVTPLEEAALEPLLTTLHGRRLLLDAQISRFGDSAGKARYLAVTRQNREIVLFVLEPHTNPPVISEPFAAAVAEGEYDFAPLTLLDADRDALPDLAFCTWPGPSYQPLRTVVGYRAARWYRITSVVKQFPVCGPQGVP